MELKPSNGYPTEQQIEDSFKAFKEGGEKGILAFLQQQRRKREAGQSPQK